MHIFPPRLRRRVMLVCSPMKDNPFVRGAHTSGNVGTSPPSHGGCTQLEEAKGKSALPAPGPPPADKQERNFQSAEPAAPGAWEPVPARADAALGENGKSAAVSGSLGSSSGVFEPGARVEVLSADKWYPAVRTCCGARRSPHIHTQGAAGLVSAFVTRFLMLSVDGQWPITTWQRV